MYDLTLPLWPHDSSCPAKKVRTLHDIWERKPVEVQDHPEAHGQEGQTPDSAEAPEGAENKLSSFNGIDLWELPIPASGDGAATMNLGLRTEAADTWRKGTVVAAWTGGSVKSQEAVDKLDDKPIAVQPLRITSSTQILYLDEVRDFESAWKAVLDDDDGVGLYGMWQPSVTSVSESAQKLTVSVVKSAVYLPPAGSSLERILSFQGKMSTAVKLIQMWKITGKVFALHGMALVTTRVVKGLAEPFFIFVD